MNSITSITEKDGSVIIFPFNQHKTGIGRKRYNKMMRDEFWIYVDKSDSDEIVVSFNDKKLTWLDVDEFDKLKDAIDYAKQVIDNG